MRLWSWLSGKARQSHRAHGFTPVSLPGQGLYATDVIGTSKHQAMLDRICGGKTRDGHRLKEIEGQSGLPQAISTTVAATPNFQSSWRPLGDLPSRTETLAIPMP